MDDIVYKGLGESNICQMFKDHQNVFWIKKEEIRNLATLFFLPKMLNLILMKKLHSTALHVMCERKAQTL